MIHGGKTLDLFSVCSSPNRLVLGLDPQRAGSSGSAAQWLHRQRFSGRQPDRFPPGLRRSAVVTRDSS